MTKTQKQISEICDEIKELLITKNRRYGDSALNPARVFSKADVIEQLKVRLDDKLSRLANAQDDEDEDVELDLIGYLILLRIAKQNNRQNETKAADDSQCVDLSSRWPSYKLDRFQRLQ